MGNTLLNFIKFLLAVVLIPIVYTSVITFQTHLTSYPKDFTEAFSGGVIACLFVFLFLYQFWAVYEAEQSMTGGIFKFLAPLDKWLAYVVPTFFILTMTLAFVVYRVAHVDGLEEQLVFISALLLAMHILVLSQDLQNPEKGLTKPTYLLILTATVLVSVFVAVFMMDIVSERSTFNRFSKQWYKNGLATYETAIDTVLFFK